MILTSDGNVGIGTTSPSYKLDVGGGNFFVNGSNRDWGGTGGLGTHIGTGDFDIYSGTPGSGTHRLKVTNGGNVGIGTTSPAYPLTVNGLAQVAGALRITETGTSQRILMGNQDSSGVNNPSIIEAANGNIHFGNGDSWNGEGGTHSIKMTVLDSGNVGIGTTSPAAKLDVCLLYTSPSPRDRTRSRMPSSA